MEEREIVAVRDVNDCDEWHDDEQCMSANPNMSSACSATIDKVLSLEYEDEPDKTFFTALCESCASTYVKKWDAAQIYGDEVLEDNNDFQIT